jgi:hypothetical protein
MADTIQTLLDKANPNDLPANLKRLRDSDDNGFGALIAGLIPRRIARTGLTSGATHVEPEPGLVSVVSIADDAALTIIEAGTAGAGEALVTYDADGVATIVFGDGAQTAYRVVKQVLPKGMAAVLAANA